jgi:hypothetical protein
LGHTTWVGTVVLHFAHNDKGFDFKPSLARRLPDREFECFLFGTAIVRNLKIVSAMSKLVIADFNVPSTTTQRLKSIISGEY